MKKTLDTELKSELNELRKHIRAANKGAERNMHALNSAIANRIKAERELAAVTEQRDRLAEAATVLIAAKGRHNTMLAYQGLREALAAVKGGSHE